jgi:hypothetical protein
MIRILCLICLFASGCSLQRLDKWRLPNGLDESSGLAPAAAGGFWTLNDSGGAPHLYRVYKQENLLHTDTLVTGVEVNRDWEELTPCGNQLLVGDFGNNRNLRQNQIIYRIDPEALVPVLGHIRFHFSDQTAFPPAPDARMFDCEAMVVRNDSIFLFTKNRTEPFTGEFGMYLLQVNGPQEQHAIRCGTGFTGKGMVPARFRVTGAALSPNGRLLAILSINAIRFYRFNGINTNLKEPVKTVRFSAKAGREAVTFTSDSTIAITCETYSWSGGRLWQYRLRRPENW